MSFKIVTTNHDSESCPGAVFRIFRKTFGRKMELDSELAKYNQKIRDLGDKRQILWEEAGIKAEESLGLNTKKDESVMKLVQTDGATQEADFVDPKKDRRYQLELLKNIDLKSIQELDEKAKFIRLTELRPIYILK